MRTLPSFLRTVVGTAITPVLVFALASAADAADRHSGRLITLNAQQGVLVLDELVTWTGPGTGSVLREIGLTPAVRAVVVTRDGAAGLVPDARGFVERPVDVTRLREGVFVTVTTAEHGGRLEALSIEAVPPGGVGAPAETATVRH